MVLNLGNIPKSAKIPMPNPNGHWKFPVPMGIDKVGFVYVIRDTILKRGYLGKKMYRRGGLLKGGQETDWKSYKTSSNTMSQIFAERGLVGFEFVVLEEYSTKSGLSFAETWSLCMVEAPTTPIWYNTRIEKVAWNVKENVTFRHKQRLEMVQDWSDVG